jgi:hypothetical protein
MAARARNLANQSTSKPFWRAIESHKDKKLLRVGQKVRVKWHDGYRQGVITYLPPDTKNIIVELDNKIGEIAIAPQKAMYTLTFYWDQEIEDNIKKEKEKNKKVHLHKYPTLMAGLEVKKESKEEEDNW